MIIKVYCDFAEREISWGTECHTYSLEHIKCKDFEQMMHGGDVGFTVGKYTTKHDIAERDDEVFLYFRCWGKDRADYQTFAVFTPSRIFIVNDSGKTSDHFTI